jgi:hypothetical protein
VPYSQSHTDSLIGFLKVWAKLPQKQQPPPCGIVHSDVPTRSYILHLTFDSSWYLRSAGKAMGSNAYVDLCRQIPNLPGHHDQNSAGLPTSRCLLNT